MLIKELIQSVDDQEKKFPATVKAEKVVVKNADNSQDLLDLSN